MRRQHSREAMSINEQLVREKQAAKQYTAEQGFIEQQALNRAFRQEQQIEKRQGKRNEMARETAAFNLQLVQEKQAAQQQSKAVERKEAVAREERSFFDRFGTSLR